MAQNLVENRVVCPWCEKGAVYTEGSGKAAVTVRCPKCLHFFRIHLDDYRTEKVQAHKRTQNRVLRLAGAHHLSGKARLDNITD